MSRIQKHKFFLLGVVTAGLISAAGLFALRMQPALAITVDRTVGASLGLGSASPESIVISIIQWTLSLLALIAVIIVLYAGFLYMISRGDEKKIERAKKILQSGLIGLVIILAAWGIVQYILSRLGDATGSGSGQSCIGQPPSFCGAAQCCSDGSCRLDCSGSLIPGGSDFGVKKTIPNKDAIGVPLCTLVAAQFTEDIKFDSLKPEQANPDDRNFTLKLVFNHALDVAVEGSDGDTCTDNMQCTSANCDTASATCKGNTIANTLSFNEEDHRWAVLYPTGRELPQFATFEAQITGSLNGVTSERLHHLVNNYTWQFSTNDTVDDTPPVVLESVCFGGDPEDEGKDCTADPNICGTGICRALASPYPADGAVDVCRATTLAVEFSEQIDPITVNSTQSFIVSQLNPGDPTFELNALPLTMSIEASSFGARPVKGQPFAAGTQHFARVFGGRPTCVDAAGVSTGFACPNGTADCGADQRCVGAFGAIQDVCGNPLDGNRNSEVNTDEIFTQGSPVDDFISSEDAVPPNDTPWNFTTGEQLQCLPNIDDIDPETAYDGLDLKNNGPSSDDNGGNGDPGYITITGDYLAPLDYVGFNGGVQVSSDDIQCFDSDYRVAGPNQVGEEDDIGQCIVWKDAGSVTVKIPPGVAKKSQVAITSVDETAVSGDDFDPLSPHIDSVSSPARPGDYITVRGRNFGEADGTVWFRVPGIGDVKHISPPSGICGDTWKNTQIVVEVPDLPLDPGDKVEIQVETAGADLDLGPNGGPGPEGAAAVDNKIGNIRELTIGLVNRPSLCRLDPICSNTGNTNVSFVGKGFHSASGPVKGKAFFGELAGTEKGWSENQVDATAPNLDFGHFDAFIQITDPDVSDPEDAVLQSNAMDFAVPCGNVPSVVSDGACNVDEDLFPSTNPRNGAQDICLDIKLAARFSTKMDMATTGQGLRNKQNVKLYNCGSERPEDTDAIGDCVAAGDEVAIASIMEDSKFNQVGGEFDDASILVNLPPSGGPGPGGKPLIPDTWYAMWFSDQLRSDQNTCFDLNGNEVADTTSMCPDNAVDCEAAGGFCGGVTMSESFASIFRTQPKDGLCKVENLDVWTPDGTQVNNGTTSLPYNAQPYGPNCMILNPGDFSGQYTWTDVNDPDDIAKITTADKKQKQVLVKATAETREKDNRRADIQCTLQEEADSAPFYTDFNICTEDIDCNLCGPGVSRCGNGVCTPVVTAVNPARGPVTRPVTVSGCYFGTSQDDTGDKVEFGGRDAKLVQQCGAGAWSNREIIVEVPEGLTVGTDAAVKVTNVDPVTGDSGVSNTDIKFSVTNTCTDAAGDPSATPADGIPLLCALSPLEVAFGEVITLTGDRFGATQEPADAVVYTSGEAFVNQTVNPSWMSTKVESTVPPAATRGHVYVSNEQCVSNGLEVRPKCSTNSQCAATSCCGTDGFCAAASVCANTGDSGELCFIENITACSDPNLPHTAPPGYQCLADDAAPPGNLDNIPERDCRFCCTPGRSYNDLFCEPDVADCKNTNPSLQLRGAYCGCIGDSVCPSSGTNGCGSVPGKGACCLARPSMVLPSDPDNGDIDFCPNGVLQFEFDQKMDTGSFAANFSLIDADNNPVAGTFKSTYDETTKHTKVQFVPDQLLAANKQHTATWKGDNDTTNDITEGVVNSYGIGMNGGYSVVFDVAANVCDLDKVELETRVPETQPGGNTFTRVDETGKAIVTGYARNGDVVYPVPGESKWTWIWTIVPNNIVNVNVPASGDPQERDLDIATNNKSGVSILKVEAVPENPPVGYSGNLSDSKALYVYICEDPWLHESGNPGFEDILGVVPGEEVLDLPAYNNVIRYCRDGYSAASDFDTVVVKDADTDITIVGKRNGDGYTMNQVPSTDLPKDVLRQYIFTQSSSESKKDAIVVFVFENPDHLSPGVWYKRYAPNPVDNFSVIDVATGVTPKGEGYEAVRVGRTAYISATNHFQDDANPDTVQNLFTNIYVVSYTKDASAETVSIYNDMLRDWEFNTNVLDPTQKEYLVRDTKRITQLGGLRSLILDYLADTGDYPNLVAGTFLSGITNSKWPSWRETFGASVGFVPEDPLNLFDPETDCEGPDFDASGTCWKPDTKEFLCPNDGTSSAGHPSGSSHVYLYSDKDAAIPRLYANMQYLYNGLDFTGSPSTTVYNPCSTSGSSTCSCFNYELPVQ